MVFYEFKLYLKHPQLRPKDSNISLKSVYFSFNLIYYYTPKQEIH